MAFKNLLGKRFGRLLVTGKNPNKKVFPSGRTATLWDCVCDCGKTTTVCAWYLLNGDTTSCGCYSREACAERGRIQLSKHNKWDLSGDFGIGYTSKGEPFYFDKEDFDKIKNNYWYYNDRGYVVTRMNQHQVSLHRYIMNPPANMVVDHIKHPPRTQHKIDNRKSNLRIVTQSENAMNRHPRIDSNYAGVTFNKSKGKWESNITVNYKTIYLGAYNKMEDALQARNNAEEKLFGEYSIKRSVIENDANG